MTPVSAFDPALTVTAGVTTTSAPIPPRCICAYTWDGLSGALFRNGAVMACPADHAAVDGR